MRILHLDPDDLGNPLAGGGPVRTYEICRRLARRHEVTVLTPTFSGSTPEKERDGVRYLRVGRKIGDHGSSHHITFLAALPAAIRRHDYDLLVEDFMPPGSATLNPLFRRRSAALVGSVQWFYARHYTEWLKLPFHWGEQYGVRLYPSLVVLSESMRRHMLERHPSVHCEVIPNGVDDSLFDIPPTAGRGLLFLGRLELQVKGIDLLLQAYAAIPEAEREPLTLAGTVQEPEALQCLIARHGLGGWVKVFGYYNPTQRAELLRGCRALVMPSRFETFGMTLSEANAAAKAAVLWDTAPMTEVASPASLRVPPFDVAALTATLRQLLAAGDDELLARGLASREFARRYTWDRAAEAQERFYLEAHDRQISTRKREARHGAG
jgi:phosphatidylinositol alpha-mannosyltransferase